MKVLIPRRNGKDMFLKSLEVEFDYRGLGTNEIGLVSSKNEEKCLVKREVVEICASPQNKKNLASL